MKIYEKSELEIIRFEAEDIITTSSADNPGDWGHDHDVVDDE